MEEFDQKLKKMEEFDQKLKKKLLVLRLILLKEVHQKLKMKWRKKNLKLKILFC